MDMLPLKSLGMNTSLLLLTSGDCDNLWHSLAYRTHSSNLCLHHHMAIFPLGGFVPKFPSYYKGTTHWIRGHCTPVWPYINLITSTKSLLPLKFQVNMKFGEDNIQLNKETYSNSYNNSNIINRMSNPFSMSSIQ